MTPKIIERIVHHGHGFNPLGTRTDVEMEALRAAMAAAGRDMAELELVGGTRAVFTRPDSVADLALALEAIPPQIAQGFTTFCIKPSQFTDDPDGVGALCREVLRRSESLIG